MAWATTADVLAMTGSTVTADELARAVAVVELFVGITEDNETELTESNLRMLKAAACYQAAWMASQVDVVGRMSVERIEQDGAVVQPGAADDLVLAPLAKRAVQRLSWMGGRSTTFVMEPVRFASVDAWQDAWLRDGTGDGWRAVQ